MITIGKGGQRRVKDYQLSRYACYLIIQNADPEKEIVALGQTYFAVQTRRQEVADAEILAGLSKISAGCICAASSPITIATCRKRPIRPA